jgi:hypothetical protein
LSISGYGVCVLAVVGQGTATISGGGRRAGVVAKGVAELDVERIELSLTGNPPDEWRGEGEVGGVGNGCIVRTAGSIFLVR